MESNEIPEFLWDGRISSDLDVLAISYHGAAGFSNWGEFQGEDSSQRTAHPEKFLNLIIGIFSINFSGIFPGIDPDRSLGLRLENTFPQSPRNRNVLVAGAGTLSAI